MTNEIVYTPSEKVNDRIREKHLIPYRVFPGTKYENGCTYYSDYWNQFFKVLSVSYTDHDILENAYVKWDDGNYGVICTDLDASDYRVERDIRNIYNTPIINSGLQYTGAEIIYWFFMNQITSYNKSYKGFWTFVDRFSSHRIQDNSKYYISGNLNDKQIYVNCKLIKVK